MNVWKRKSKKVSTKKKVSKIGRLTFIHCMEMKERERILLSIKKKSAKLVDSLSYIVWR